MNLREKALEFRKTYNKWELAGTEEYEVMADFCQQVREDTLGEITSWIEGQISDETQKLEEMMMGVEYGNITGRVAAYTRTLDKLKKDVLKEKEL